MDTLTHIERLLAGAATQRMNRQRFGLEGCAPTDAPRLSLLADWSATLHWIQSGAPSGSFNLETITEHLNTI